MDLDQVIMEADPVREVTIPTPQSAHARWSYAQITAIPMRPSWRRHKMVVTTALVAPALVLALLLSNVMPTSLGGTGSAAAAALNNAASAASAQPPKAPGAGQYLYTVTEGLYQATVYMPGSATNSMSLVASAQYRQTSQVWSTSSGTGRGLLTRGDLVFKSAADERAWNASSAGPAFVHGFNHTVNESDLRQNVANVSQLPTAPLALANVIARSQMGTNVDLIPNGPTATFERAIRLLVGPSSGMTPALASALFHVLANQPGTVLVGPTADHTGHRGIGVLLPTATGANELIFDPTTGSALEARYVPQRSPSLGGGNVVLCAADGHCISTAPNALSPTSVTTVAPQWVDTVTKRIVNSDTATR